MKPTRYERSENASRAASQRWRREEDRGAATLPARQGFLRRFENAADPQHLLPQAERRRRGHEHLVAYMRSLRHRQSTS
jgi:hypothetical protein